MDWASVGNLAADYWSVTYAFCREMVDALWFRLLFYLLIVAVTIGYNLIEAILAIAAGTTASSIALIGLVLFHCAWPLRSRLYNEETSWTERGHLFSWRMMLRAKEVGIGYAIVDPATGRAANVDHKQFIDAEQAEKFARDPELIRQMAHSIAAKFEKEMGRRPEVYALVLASLNGRKPQLMIDPNVDLAAQTLSLWGKPSWILPLTEPFRKEAWRVPVEQWKGHVDLPPIKFVERIKALQKSRESDPDKS